MNLRFLRRPEIRLISGDLTDPDSIALPRDLDVIVHAAALVSDNATRRQCRRQIYDVTVDLLNAVLGLDRTPGKWSPARRL